MPKQIAWSYSALTSYETCPKRHFLTKVSKEVVEPQTEPLLWGNKVHKALEMYAKGKQPLPAELKKYSKYVDRILKFNGKKLIEERWALNSAFRPVKFFAKDVWVRGVCDIGVVGSKKAMLFDYKTGKHKPDSEQMMLMALMAFAHYPWIETVETGFIWLKDAKMDREVFHVEDKAELWDEFLPRINRLQNAHDNDKWMPKPSGLCAKWCPVRQHMCEFSGKS